MLELLLLLSSKYTAVDNFLFYSKKIKNKVDGEK